MSTVFHEGDRVEMSFYDFKLGMVKAVGTVHSADVYGILYVMRDDGVKGSGPEGSWMCGHLDARLLERPAAFTGELQPVTVDAKKEWQPDGFDANAHREFMKNLCG